MSYALPPDWLSSFSAIEYDTHPQEHNRTASSSVSAWLQDSTLDRQALWSSADYRKPRKVQCQWPGCGATFSRKADLNRHISSTHKVKLIDCDVHRCSRVGENGFARKDHLLEHKRGYHNQNIPKRLIRGKFQNDHGTLLRFRPLSHNTGSDAPSTPCCDSSRLNEGLLPRETREEDGSDARKARAESLVSHSSPPQISGFTPLDPSLEPLSVLSSPASDHYYAGIVNLSCQLVYSWLEGKQSPVSSPRARSLPFQQCTSGPDGGDSQNAKNEQKSEPNSRSFIVNSGWKNRKRLVDEHEDPDGDQDDEDDVGNNKRRRFEKVRDQIGKLWACPFFKHDPTTYSLLNNCKCSTHLLDTISRLKQHLYRTHCSPPFYCRRCFEIYHNEESLQTHSGQEISCLPKPSPFTDNVTSAQLILLKKKTPKKTEEERWYHVYGILFSGEEPPESPFLEEASPLQAVVNDLCQYVRDQAPAQLTERIRSGLLQLPSLSQPHLEDGAWEAAMGDVVAEAVAYFCDLTAARASRRGESHSHTRSEDLDRATPGLTSGSSEVTGTISGSMFAIVEAHFDQLPQIRSNDWDFKDLFGFDSVPKLGDAYDEPLPQVMQEPEVQFSDMFAPTSPPVTWPQSRRTTISTSIGR